MNGPQDVGGRAGFGPVAPERDEPLFHAEWERRALGITLCCGVLGHWNIDSSRHARESLPPAIYYGASYYEIWIRALEALLMDAGELTHEELSSAQPLAPGKAAARCLKPDRVAAVLSAGAPVNRPASAPARFAPGDRVRTRNHQPCGHTRLPAYARQKTGVIEAIRGHHVYPDAHAHGAGEAPEWLYTVSFDAADLYGDGADPTLRVSIDAWEPYLDPA